ncbi:MAG: hypothetical protein WCT32_01235 [Patescibacteria group bacterium]|jgi:hypothetical protein
MKKVTEKWKKRSRIIAKKNLIRKRKKRGLIKATKLSRIFKRVIAPSVFSILNDHQHFLEFCGRIENNVNKGYSVFLDLSVVSEITLDAILYLLSLLEFFGTKRVAPSIQGNEPREEKCRMIFRDSGFYKFVKLVRGDPPRMNDDIFSIQSGERTQGAVVLKVVEFVASKMNGPKRSTEGIYETLVELMNNTNEHAYLSDSPLPKWWTAAYYNADIRKISFAFLDNGQGIPTTVRKNFAEIVLKYLIRSDADLIRSALEGKFKRSRTKQKNRGKGLPQIYEISNRKKIDNLKIVSNRGFISAVHFSQHISIKEGFRGTLFSWDFQL